MTQSDICMIYGLLALILSNQEWKGKTVFGWFAIGFCLFSVFFRIAEWIGV